MANEIVFEGVGHGGDDPGTSGNSLVEKTVALNIAMSCRNVLTAHGVGVVMSRMKDENDPVMEEVYEANASRAKIAVEFHLNAGGGDGFEVYYSRYAGLGLTLAKNIESEVIAIGQNSRGCKTKLGSDGRDYYAFIRETNMDAVICEFAFLDNATDVQVIDSPQEQERMGVAVAKGILKTLGIAYVPPVNIEEHRNIIVYNDGAEPDRFCAEYFNMILNNAGEDCRCISYSEYSSGKIEGRSRFAVGGSLKGKFNYHKIFAGKDRNETAYLVKQHLNRY